MKFNFSMLTDHGPPTAELLKKKRRKKYLGTLRAFGQRQKLRGANSD